jgi:pilus assembly protein Flp/PilA
MGRKCSPEGGTEARRDPNLPGDLHMIQMLQVYLLQLIDRFRRDQSGAALVEYGIVVGLIAVVCFAAVQTLGLTVQGVLNAINTALQPLLAG